MSEPGFFVVNRYRAFPFLAGTVGGSGGTGSMANLPNDAVVDAGFLIGPTADFRPAAHKIWLASVHYDGTKYVFTVASDCPGLYGRDLVFTRLASDPDYMTQFNDTSFNGQSDFSDSWGLCSEPFWSGYLTTGNLAQLIAAATDFTSDSTTGVFEPALAVALGAQSVKNVNLANDDRTRVTAPSSCPDLSWPNPIGLAGTFGVGNCLAGPLRFWAGYNCVIRQNSDQNQITFTAVVGGGEGEPCREVETYPGERAAIDSPSLSGAPECNGVLRSINGQGGRLFTLLSGQGVNLASSPAENSLAINVDMSGLAVCPGSLSLSYRSESIGE